MCWYGSNLYSSRGKMRYKDMKKSQQKFGRKRKSTGYSYFPGSQYLASLGYLKLRSSLHDTVINSASSIRKYINKIELYIQFPYRREKVSHE